MKPCNFGSIVASGVLVVLMLCLNASAQTKNFSIKDGKIYDPDGKLFVPTGFNLHGPTCFWPLYDGKKTSEMADDLDKVWKVNTVRLNSCYNTPCRGWPTFTDNNDLDQIIQNLTARKIVVQISFFDKTGGLPDDAMMKGMTTKFVEWAKKHADNPYFWINCLNEPGNSTLDSRWKTVHSYMITELRKVTQNIIVCDGIWWGQEGTSYDDNFYPAKSAILTYGPDLAKLGNVVFSFHAYEQWKGSYLKMKTFVDLCRAKGLAIHIGEAGVRDGGAGHQGSEPGFLNGIRATKELDVGILVWHGQPGDNFKVLKDQRSFFLVSDPTYPINLNRIGKAFWDMTHAMCKDNTLALPLSCSSELTSIMQQPQNRTDTPVSQTISLRMNNRYSIDGKVVKGGSDEPARKGVYIEKSQRKLYRRFVE